MGLVYSNFHFIYDQKRELGLKFVNGITLGRQQIFLRAREYQRLCDKYGITSRTLPKFGTCDDQFLENAFGCSITSADYSDYEGAELVHDFNRALDSSWYGKYDLVIDGGTLEHVFNFPQAIANCMNLLKKDGHLFIFTPANNNMGHGFYQFSPELFYRVLDDENGFQVKSMVLCDSKYPGVELDDNLGHWRVADPVKVESRVGLVSNRPAWIMVHAVKTADKPVFEKYPIQSDYATTYEQCKVEGKNPESARKTSGRIKAKVKAILPGKLLRGRIGKAQLNTYSVKNKEFYEKLDW